MTTIRFGIQVDMRGSGTFNPPLDSYLGGVSGIGSVSSSRITAFLTTGGRLLLFGHFDLSSEEAALDSDITGMAVYDRDNKLVMSVTNLPPINLGAAQDDPAQLTRALMRDLASGYSLTASRFDDVVVGLAGSDILNGGGGDDVLRGGAGNDRLDGAAGDDLLDGGRGVDRMTGGSGDDAFLVDAVDDLVVEAARGGTDTVRASLDWTLGAQLEKLVLSGTAALSGTGNALANTLFGNSGANLLTGLAGHDILNGGAGADRLVGGPGNDTYVVDRLTDRVVERAGEGTDTVQTALTYTLPSQVENLSLTGSAARSGTGNGLANIVRGNSGANHLLGLGGADDLAGGAGNDTLVGGTGQDRLSGGADADRFVFSHSGVNADVVTDFLPGTDSLWLDPSVFEGLTPGALDGAQFSTDPTAGDFLRYDPASGVLAYDTLGAGGDNLVAIVTLLPGTGLLATDIHVALPV